MRRFIHRHGWDQIENLCNVFSLTERPSLVREEPRCARSEVSALVVTPHRSDDIGIELNNDTYYRGFARVTILTVPKNHECAMPASVKPKRNTLNPAVNTAVFATAAGANPGELLFANSITVVKATETSGKAVHFKDLFADDSSPKLRRLTGFTAAHEPSDVVRPRRDARI